MSPSWWKTETRKPKTKTTSESPRDVSEKRKTENRKRGTGNRKRKPQAGIQGMSPSWWKIENRKPKTKATSESPRDVSKLALHKREPKGRLRKTGNGKPKNGKRETGNRKRKPHAGIQMDVPKLVENRKPKTENESHK